MEFTLLIFSLLLFLPASQAAIRCYCNSPACESTNHLCTSQLGKCFSQFGYSTELEESAGSSSMRGAGHSSHGCVEELGEEEEDVCLVQQGDLIKARSPPSPWPVLMCCTETMCNYIDTLDVKITANNRSSSIESTPSNEHHLSPQDLWFKAAVIAVPIAGVFILILLVLLAVRMLRADTRRHHTHTLAKTQLYIPDYTDHAKHYGHGSSLSSTHHHHPMFYHPSYGHYIGYTDAPGKGGGGGGSERGGCVEDVVMGSECGAYEKISDCGSSDISSSGLGQGPHCSLIVEQKQHGPGTIV